MPTYVAFLRAINLGAKRKFPKADLAAATRGAGFAGVETHINTGNVRIETAMRSRARIEQKLETAYRSDRGFEVPTIVLSLEELREVAADADELAATVGSAGGLHYVSLLKEERSAEDIAALEERSTAQERVVVRRRAAHLLLGEDYHTARLTNATVERHLGVSTNRNVTVIRALATKWG